MRNEKGVLRISKAMELIARKVQDPSLKMELEFLIKETINLSKESCECFHEEMSIEEASIKYEVDEHTIFSWIKSGKIESEIVNGEVVVMEDVSDYFFY